MGFEWLSKSNVHGDISSTLICKYWDMSQISKNALFGIYRHPIGIYRHRSAPWASNRKQPTSSASAASALHMWRPLSLPTEWKSSTVASEVSGSVLNMGRTAEGSNLSCIIRVQTQPQKHDISTIPKKCIQMLLNVF